VIGGRCCLQKKRIKFNLICIVLMYAINFDIYVFAEDFIRGNLQQAAEVKNPVLAGIADGLPKLLAQARAPTTNRSYGYAYKKWKDWADNFDEVVALPAKPVHIILYLMVLGKNAKTFSAINLAVSAIAWAHKLAGRQSPTEDILVLEAIKGLKRQLGKPSLPKEPFTIQNINQFVLIMSRVSLKDIRNTIIIVLAFYAFLRVDEVRHLKTSQIKFKQGHLEILIKKSKCDQLRLGDTVVVAKLGGPKCPVGLLELYLDKANIKLETDQFLFRRICNYKGCMQIYKKDCPISYSIIRDAVKEKAKQIGLDPRQYSTHSMRSGGATAAADDGVNDRIMQRHGRWASSQSKNRYVKDKLSKRLSVTNMLS
jgi:integrase